MGSKVRFIISLPRSGSSLLQNLIVSNSSNTITREEPWLLLWLFDFMVPESISSYSTDFRNRAIDKFFAGDLELKAGEIADSVYRSIAGKKIFLDKTPRYFYVIDSILKVWGAESVVVLVRDPVQVYFSMLAKHNNRIRTAYSDLQDLIIGSNRIAKAASDPDVLVVNYTDLINAKVEIDGILEHLGVSKKEVTNLSYNTPKKKVSFGDNSSNLYAGRLVVQKKRYKVSIVHYLFLKSLIQRVDVEYFKLCGLNSEISLKQVELSLNPWINCRDIFDISYYFLALLMIPIRFKSRRFWNWYG